MARDLRQAYVYYSEDYFLSITQRLGKKTIYGWALTRKFRENLSIKRFNRNIFPG